MKSPYANIEGWRTEAHPNAVVGTLDAIEAKFGIPVLYTFACSLPGRRSGGELAVKALTYWWLEEHGHGRVLIDDGWVVGHVWEVFARPQDSACGAPHAFQRPSTNPPMPRAGRC